MLGWRQLRLRKNLTYCPELVDHYNTPFTFITELPTHRNLTVSTYTEGLAYLFRSDSSAVTFTRIIAQWQNTMRPVSRLVLLGLFLAGGACFLWFVLQQLKILAPILL